METCPPRSSVREVLFMKTQDIKTGCTNCKVFIVIVFKAPFCTIKAGFFLSCFVLISFCSAEDGARAQCIQLFLIGNQSRIVYLMPINLFLLWFSLYYLIHNHSFLSGVINMLKMLIKLLIPIYVFIFMSY